MASVSVARHHANRNLGATHRAASSAASSVEPLASRTMATFQLFLVGALTAQGTEQIALHTGKLAKE
jgi:hypothetical protein